MSSDGKAVVPTHTPQESPLVGYSSLVTLIVPVTALFAALLSGSLLLLDYVHVITGATWTGIDLFMGMVMSRILRSLPSPARVEFI
ncbi:MAG: hypothetical protein JRN20_21100, partial [Nitrososphaerota archaeon]|nr:hypothetical protein [Nitrososphaerota archaeon]